MNKKELIKSYEAACFAITSVSTVLEDLKQLDDEKEKVTLPWPVANWISCVRGRNKTLHFALENAPEEVNLWFCEDEKIGKIFLLTLGSMAIISRERSGIL